MVYDEADPDAVYHNPSPSDDVGYLLLEDSKQQTNPLYKAPTN